MVAKRTQDWGGGPGGGLLVGRPEGVRVYPEGCGDVRMAQPLLHRLEVNSLGQKDTGMGMPKLMKRDMAEAGLAGQLQHQV